MENTSGFWTAVGLCQLLERRESGLLWQACQSGLQGQETGFTQAVMHPSSGRLCGIQLSALIQQSVPEGEWRPELHSLRGRVRNLRHPGALGDVSRGRRAQNSVGWNMVTGNNGGLWGLHTIIGFLPNPLVDGRRFCFPHYLCWAAG